jgi:hypothetical protein
MENIISSRKRERDVDGSDGNLDNGETEQHFFQRLVDPDFEELSR